MVIAKSGVVIRALCEKQPNERLEDAIYRFLPDETDYYSGYTDFLQENLAMERMRNKTVKLATEKKYKAKNLGDQMCMSCWKKMVKATFREFGKRCVGCGTSDHVTAHHILPRDERGPNEVWNLMPLCEVCHNYVEVHDSKPRTRDACTFLAQNKDLKRGSQETGIPLLRRSAQDERGAEAVPWSYRRIIQEEGRHEECH